MQHYSLGLSVPASAEALDQLPHLRMERTQALLPFLISQLHLQGFPGVMLRLGSMQAGRTGGCWHWGSLSETGSGRKAEEWGRIRGQGRAETYLEVVFYFLFFSLLFAACDHKPIGISCSVGPEDVPAAWEGQASHLRAVGGTEAASNV